MYAVKEIYHTIQGEGHQQGRPAVFCRFSGCNLWSGLEKDRDSAICRFCDTNFWGTDGVHGGKYGVDGLVQQIADLFVGDHSERFVVLTGGEPALQVDDKLIDALHAEDFFIAIETNGTRYLPDGIDWVCMSPKAGTEIVITAGDEIKVVIPQEGIDPADFEDMDFDHHYVQAMETDSGWSANQDYAIKYALEHPKWKLSVQTHKYIGIR